MCLAVYLARTINEKKYWKFKTIRENVTYLVLENQCVDVKDMEAELHAAENACAHVEGVHLCKPMKMSASGGMQMHSHVDL